MLTTRQQYLAAIADLFGGLDVGTFTSRLVLQKRMFFVSMCGVDLGYRHSWYLRGPYSPTLTRDAFAVGEERKAGGSASLSLPETLRTRLQTVRGKLGEAWDDPDRLELLASVLYIGRTVEPAHVKHLTERVRSLKPAYTEEQISEAASWLVQKGFLHG